MAKITTYTVDSAKRRIITVKNMEELGITDELIQNFLKKKVNELRRIKVNENGTSVRDSKDQEIPLWPVGVSINDKKFGNFPDPNAAQRGWIAFFEIGAPLLEERSNIIPPVADIISTRTYDNRSSEVRQFSDTIEFTVGNTISWSLEGMGSFTFGGKIEGGLQAQISQTIEKRLEESLANSLEKGLNHKDHNHKDDIGTEDESEVKTKTEYTSSNSGMTSFTATGTATGLGELHAEVALSLTGTISGTVTTSWNSISNVSGNIPANSRVETLATQRRQVKQFTYEVPITFDGFIALNYDELVFPISNGEGPPLANINSNIPSKVIPVNISYLDLNSAERNKLYKPKGIAETVSALDVNHSIFDIKQLNRHENQKFGTERPHNL